MSVEMEDTTLYYDGHCIGSVALGPLVAGRRQGILTPNESYLSARPALQRLTLGSLAHATDPLEWLHVLQRELALLRASGLAMHDSAGARLQTKLIMVGDFLPENADLIVMAAVVPLPVEVVMDE